MSYVTWKVVRAAFVPTTNTWSASTTDIPHFMDIKVSKSIGAGKDSFSMKIHNFNNNYGGYFQPQDKLFIYRSVNSALASSTDLLMIGSIKDTPQQMSGTVNLLRVEGYNFSEIIGDAIAFSNPAGLPIPQALQQCLSSVNVYNTNFQLSWDPLSANLNSVGASFPLVNERIFNKPLKYVFEKYSTQQQTGDGSYIWYVTTTNTIVWRRALNTSSYTFNSATDTWMEMKVAKDVQGIKNYVICKGGYDPAGKQIQTKYQDGASIAKYGQKYYMLISQSNTGENLNAIDLAAAYGTDYSKQNTKYPTFPFTSTWQSNFTGTVETISMVKGSSVTIADSGNTTTNQNRYIAVLRAQVVSLLKDEARAYVEDIRYGKLKMDLTFMPGQKTWGLGDRITLNIAQYGIVNKTLNVEEISYGEIEDTYSLTELVGTV